MCTAENCWASYLSQIFHPDLTAFRTFSGDSHRESTASTSPSISDVESQQNPNSPRTGHDRTHKKYQKTNRMSNYLYPPEISHNHWKWPCVLNFPIKFCDFPCVFLYVCFPECAHLYNLWKDERFMDGSCTQRCTGTGLNFRKKDAELLLNTNDMMDMVQLK